MTPLWSANKKCLSAYGWRGRSGKIVWRPLLGSVIIFGRGQVPCCTTNCRRRQIVLEHNTTCYVAGDKICREVSWNLAAQLSSLHRLLVPLLVSIQDTYNHSTFLQKRNSLLSSVLSTPLIKTALRLSSAKITLKLVWKP